MSLKKSEWFPSISIPFIFPPFPEHEGYFHVNLNKNLNFGKSLSPFKNPCHVDHVSERDYFNKNILHIWISLALSTKKWNNVCRVASSMLHQISVKSGAWYNLLVTVWHAEKLNPDFQSLYFFVTLRTT